MMDFLLIFLAENGYLALMENAFNNTNWPKSLRYRTKGLDRLKTRGNLLY